MHSIIPALAVTALRALSSTASSLPGLQPIAWAALTTSVGVIGAVLRRKRSALHS